MNGEEKRINFLLKLRDFLKDNGYSIAHEDYHGAFIIVEYEDEYDEWLSNAFTNYKSYGNCRCGPAYEDEEKD